MGTIDDVPYRPANLDLEALAKQTENAAFAEAAFEVLKELLQSVQLAGSIRRVDEHGRPRPFTRDEAICGGLVIRCGKLLVGLLSTAARQHVELVVYFVRGIVETAINLQYLLAVGSRDAFDEYVRYSLHSDKKLQERIEANMAERGDNAWPIEARMLTGIARSFELGEIDPGSVDTTRRRSWGEGSIFRRFKYLGLDKFYEPFFGLPSAHSHGNWHELYAYHIRKVEGGFELDAKFGETDPQPLAAVCIVVTDAIEAYLRSLIPEGGRDLDELIRRLNRCRHAMQQIERLHEAFLGED